MPDFLQSNFVLFSFDKNLSDSMNWVGLGLWEGAGEGRIEWKQIYIIRY